MALNYAVGSLTGGNLIANVLGHALVGCATASAGGGHCGQGAAAGAAGSAVSNLGSSVGGVSTGALFIQTMIAGGVSAELAGGNFGNGAQAAALGFLFNCMMHTDSQNCGDPHSNSDLAGYSFEEGGTVAGQAGVQLSAHSLILGFSYSEMISIDSNARLCSILVRCGRIGPGVFIGGGAVGGLTVSPGVSSPAGSRNWSVGLGFDLGTGVFTLGGQAQYGVTDGSVSGLRGGRGYGGGGSIGLDICVSEVRMCRGSGRP